MAAFLLLCVLLAVPSTGNASSVELSAKKPARPLALTQEAPRDQRKLLDKAPLLRQKRHKALPQTWDEIFAFTCVISFALGFSIPLTIALVGSVVLPWIGLTQGRQALDQTVGDLWTPVIPIVGPFFAMEKSPFWSQHPALSGLMVVLGMAQLLGLGVGVIGAIVLPKKRRKPRPGRRASLSYHVLPYATAQGAGLSVAGSF